MRTVPTVLGLGLLLTACDTGNRYDQGGDLGVDDDSGNWDNGYTTDGGADDGGSEDGGSSDGGSSDGGSSDGGSGDGGGPGYCHHDYHPLHETGWTKTFSATFSFIGDANSTGTATESSFGITTLPDGTEGYSYLDETTVSGGESYSVTTYVACDPGSEEGMFVVAWDGSYDFGGFLAYTVDATLSSPGRQYLPPEYALGAVGSWDYSYSLNIDAVDGTGKSSPNPYTVTGSYAEAGIQSYTLFNGETVDAYKLVNTYQQVGQLGTVNGYIEQWWVKGLGLVKEVHLDMDTGSTIASKELTSYSGLTID